MRVYDAQRGWTPLRAAEEGGHLPVVTALLAAGANKEAVDKVCAVCDGGLVGGSTPLIARGKCGCPGVCDVCACMARSGGGPR